MGFSSVWNNITHVNAKTQSQAMYTTPEVKSGINTNAQWSVITKWITNSGRTLIDKTWGNFKDSQSPANVTGFGLLQKSGFSDYWKFNNIYDFAGNTFELRNELYRFIYNGEDKGLCISFFNGSYSSTSNIKDWWMISGATVPSTHYSVDVSFRVVLYIL